MYAIGFTPNFSSYADTDRDLGGKTILIVEGSLLAGAELADAFHRAGAQVHLTTATSVRLIGKYHLG